MLRRAAVPALLVALVLAQRAHAEERPAYPPVKTVDAADVLHGERVADPYRWLEPDDTPEVEVFDRAQDALTRRYLDAVPQRAALRARVEAELDLEGTRSVPRFEGGREWFTKRAAGANHAVLYAADEDGAKPPRVVIDPNAWSEDGTEAMSAWDPSPDGRWLAYRRVKKGGEEATLFLRDLSTGQDVDFRLTRLKHSSVVWAPDASGFWYTRLPDPESVPKGEQQLHRRVFFHRLGDVVADDEPVYGRGRPSIESMYAWTSTDQETVFLGRGMPYRNDDFFTLVRKDGATVVEPVFVGAPPAQSQIDRVGDRWIVVTDWDAPKKRVLSAPVGPTTPPERWRTIVPEGDAVLETIAVARDRLVLLTREDLVSRLRVVDVEGKPLGEVPLPGPGTVSPWVGTKPGDPRIWFEFDAYDRPTTIYACDVSAPTLSLVEVARAPTTVDTGRLVVERFRYPSKDGTEIPLFVLRRKDVALDGRAPTVLYGYGGFRAAMLPRWARTWALWADAGGVMAVAGLRGGDEYGEAWHEAGCLGKKQNVFDDMIAGADWLVSTGRASRERLAIEGGSNGGLLVAVVANQRPDLCRAVVCAVPLTDMLRFHRFQYAKTWTMEYGSPDVPAECAWIRAYSPYHNVKPGTAYPAILVTAGLQDSRVDAFHARKIVAAWQAATSSTRPVLLKIDRDSGHGSASRRQAKADQTDRLSFLAWQLGLEVAGAKPAAAPPVPTPAPSPGK